MLDDGRHVGRNARPAASTSTSCRRTAATASRSTSAANCTNERSAAGEPRRRAACAAACTSGAGQEDLRLRASASAARSSRTSSGSTPRTAWGSQQYAPGNYYNKTPHTMFYTPDLDRPAFTDFYQRGQQRAADVAGDGEAQDHGSFSIQQNCACNCYVQYRTVSPEAVVNYTYFPINLAQAPGASGHQQAAVPGGRLVPAQHDRAAALGRPPADRHLDHRALDELSVQLVRGRRRSTSRSTAKDTTTRSTTSGSRSRTSPARTPSRSGSRRCTGSESYGVIHVQPDAVSYQFLRRRADLADAVGVADAPAINA